MILKTGFKTAKPYQKPINLFVTGWQLGKSEIVTNSQIPMRFNPLNPPFFYSILNSDISIHHIFLTSGEGIRLWPLSRQYRPKQTLDIFKGNALFELSVLRNSNNADELSPLTPKGGMYKAKGKRWSSKLKVNLKAERVFDKIRLAIKEWSETTK